MSRKTAFVAGATGGLGRAACLALAQDWDAIALGYHSNAAKAATLAAELPAACMGLPVHCDLTDFASIEQAIAMTQERLGEIGTVVFASGFAIEQPFVSTIREEQWREVLDLELLGLTRIVRAMLPVFRAQGHGNFVVVVSVANYHYPPGDALSSVPKAAMEALGRAIAKEEGKFNIRANMVAPGIMDAGLGSLFIESMYTPEIWEAQKRGIALRRFGAAEEVGDVIAFLASEKARYVTGQTIIVDGGFSL